MKKNKSIYTWKFNQKRKPLINWIKKKQNQKKKKWIIKKKCP